MEDEKPLRWISSSRKDLMNMPEDVCRFMGFILGKIQNDEDDESIKPLSGRKEFRGSKVREICKDENTDTYRSVLTIAHEEAVYVLHCFKKKSKHGIETPQEDIDKILERMKAVDRFRASPDGQKLIAEWKARKTGSKGNG